MIAGGFAAGGDSITKREVYSARLSTETILGKRRYTKLDRTTVISFDDRDLSRITTPQEDALVITAEIAKCQVERILVDGGSSSDLMYLQCYDAMGLDRKLLRSVNTPLVGFAGKTTYAAGIINLPLVLGTGWDLLVLNTDFIVVDAPNTYNVILGRTTINPNKIVASTTHQVMRFPSLSGEIGEVWGDQQASRRCYVNVLRLKNRKEFLALQEKKAQKQAEDQGVGTSEGFTRIENITESLSRVHLSAEQEVDPTPS